MTIKGKDNAGLCLVPQGSQMTRVTACAPTAAGQPVTLDNAFHSANNSTLGTDCNGESKIGNKKKLELLVDDANDLIDGERDDAEHEMAFDLERAADAEKSGAELVFQTGVDA